MTVPNEKISSSVLGGFPGVRPEPSQVLREAALCIIAFNPKSVIRGQPESSTRMFVWYRYEYFCEASSRRVSPY